MLPDSTRVLTLCLAPTARRPALLLAPAGAPPIYLSDVHDPLAALMGEVKQEDMAAGSAGCEFGAEQVLATG